MNPEIISSSTTNLMANVTMSRPALSWCSKCGQSMEISSESNLFKSKTNFKFRKIFDLDNSEVLIKSFSCALVDDILFQGTLYASQNHFCFFSRIANKHKKIIISISQIVEITKEKTAGIFPNAIAIRTQHNRHLFASFVYREVAFRCLNEVWGAHQAERFTANWSIAFHDDACSKESPLLDIEVETDSLINPAMLEVQCDLLDHLNPDPFCLDIDESTDMDMIGTKIPASAIYKAKSRMRRPSDSSIVTHNIPHCKSDSSITFFRVLFGSVFDFISRDHMQLTMAVVIIIFLILYIIILAWKIHNLQLTLLEHFLSPKSLAENEKSRGRDILCPTTDDSCQVYRDSVLGHQSRISKVQSDLKETLTLLQSVVEISGQIFGRLKTTPLSSITESKLNKNDL